MHRFFFLVGAWILVACGGEKREVHPVTTPQGGAPPARSSEPATSPPSSAPTSNPAPPATAPSSSATAASSSCLRRTRSFEVGGGWEALSAFAALRVVFVDVDACYKALLTRNAAAAGEARLMLRLLPKG